MATTYFIGAGASAADGLPLMKHLNFGVASYTYNSANGAADLAGFYEDLYGISPEALAVDTRCWEAYLNNRSGTQSAESSRLPDLIETLSLIDVCITDEQSLGLGRKRAGSERFSELDPTHLRSVRSQLTMAIAAAVQEAAQNRRSPLSHRLVRRLEAGDAVISTNWDMLMDRCMVAASKPHDAHLKQSPIRYHCVGERPVNYRGEDIQPAHIDARSLLKLHGGLNWFGCACCGNVYINLEGSWVIDPRQRRPDFDECHCGAGLLNVMIAPSFVKDYRQVSLRSVWREAQKQLERSARWVFIGYSLPSDDYHIRAMLMRAMRTRLCTAGESKPTLEIVAVLQPADVAERRYKDMFRIVPCHCEMTGFESYLDGCDQLM